MKKINIFKSKKEKNNSKQYTSSEVKWPEYVVELDGKNFQEFVEKYPLSIIDFWASWCAPCKAMSPRLRRLSNIYKGKVAFGKLNTQENQEIAKKYKIFGIPHLIFFRYGKKISSMTGLKSVGNIKEVIEKNLKNDGR